MATLIIFCYLCVVFLYLYFSKQKSQKPLLKNSKTKFAFCKSFKENFLFCSKNSTLFETSQMLKNHTLVFNSIKQLNSMSKILTQSGINPNFPVIKLEFYKKSNFIKNTKILLCLKKLLQKGYKINVLLFVDNYYNFKKFCKILKVLNLTKLVKIYHCLEVHYNLLSTINYFNCYKENQISYLQKSASFSQNLLPNGFFCIVNNTIFSLEKIGFEDNNLVYYLNTKNLKINLKKTYNAKENCYVYCLESSFKNNKIDCFTFGYNKKENNCKKIVFNKNGNKIFFCTENAKTPLQIIGNFNTSLLNGSLCLYKTISQTANPEYYFAKACDTKSFAKIKYKNIEKYFESSSVSFNSLCLPKVLTTNKTLNMLLNYYLPQKIINNKLLETHVEDFENLKNMSFKLDFLDKTVANIPLQSHFLASNNLFKLYFNLMYYCLGIWPAKNGLNLNQNKNYIQANSIITLNQNKKVFLSMNNLKNEVKINNILFSNLNFIPYPNSNNLKIVF